MNEDKRTISRTFRMSIDVDNEILKQQKELGIQKLTDAYSVVIKLGLDVLRYKDKIRASPEEREKLSKELENNTNKIIRHSVASMRISEIGDEDLEFILSKVVSELQHREQERAKIDGYRIGTALSRILQEKRGDMFGR
jgi:hypothetical protein